jgi:hypothetical protein
VIPTGKLVPGAKSAVNDDSEQLSLAVGTLHVATAEQSPGVAGITMFAGAPEITGDWVSFTVTVKVAMLVFPDASVAV